MRSTTVVLIDDHDMLRAGVRDFLTGLAEYEVVGEASTARAGLQIVDARKPDIVLVDIALPGMDGIVATREILRRTPRSRVVVLSAHKQIQDVVDALAAGATGYVLKADPPDTLKLAMDRARRGTRYLAPTIAGLLDRAKASASTPTVLDVLSEREREIFRLFADCLTAGEIARDLCLARKTVDTHLNRINRKLGLRDRAELVRLAVNLGLVHSLREIPSPAGRANGVGAHVPARVAAAGRC
jgi:DNA-binding NarL/FixJ family response regulator